MFGLVHHTLDGRSAKAAAEQAITYVDYDNSNLKPEHRRQVFRFFEASDCIRFYKGDVSTGKYKRQEETFHPFHDTQKIYQYLHKAAVEDLFLPPV